ncbi:Homogentisate 1,2-dioxygenase [Trichoderma austrokoningii]
MDEQMVFSSLDGEALIVLQFGALDITIVLGKILPCRGYSCELYQRYFRLPELRIIGTTGLANCFDFQISQASSEGSIEQGPNGEQITSDNNGLGGWAVITPNLRYGHADPSVFVLLTAPSFGKAPGTAVADFACVGPRWQVAENTYPLPWYHQNTMQEFVFGIISDQREESPFNHSEFGSGPLAAYFMEQNSKRQLEDVFKKQKSGRVR